MPELRGSDRQSGHGLRLRGETEEKYEILSCLRKKRRGDTKSRGSGKTDAGVYLRGESAAGTVYVF